MTSYWFAHAVGAIAFLVGIPVFFHRDDRKFKLQLSFYSAIISIHFFLMGQMPPGASALLNAGRTVIATRTHNLFVMFAFVILTLVFGLSGLKHAVELLPIIGTLIKHLGIVPHQWVDDTRRHLVLHTVLGNT